MIGRLMVGAALALAPVTLAAQAGGATHLLLVTGLSAEPRFAAQFAKAASAVFDAARSSWHVADSSLIYLSEDPATDPKRMTGKATRPAIEDAFGRLARRVHAGDVVLVVLIGHGSGEMQASAVNVAGPDPTAADYATWLAPLAPAQIVFVNAATASGDFAKVLAAPNRVIVTATRTGMEKNESVFAGYFATGLTGTESDADKDGRISIVEAFDYAKARVAKEYESTNRLLTEHAVLVDSSGIASRIAFGGDATSADPRVAALVGERRILEGSVDSLRRIKATLDSATYSRELERLLLAVARKSQAIKALQPAGKP